MIRHVTIIKYGVCDPAKSKGSTAFKFPPAAVVDLLPAYSRKRKFRPGIRKGPMRVSEEDGKQGEAQGRGQGTGGGGRRRRVGGNGQRRLTGRGGSGASVQVTVWPGAPTVLWVGVHPIPQCALDRPVVAGGNNRNIHTAYQDSFLKRLDANFQK